MTYLTETLHSKHNRKTFSCGKPSLDNYFLRQASQDTKRKLSVCFVHVDEGTGLISAFYTLSSNSISKEYIPSEFASKLPKSYASIPAILIGRFAIDNRFQNRGLGKLLLIDALKRSYDISLKIGIFAVVVDPIDEVAINFYKKYGFILLPDSGKMFLPMKTIKQLFNS
jgi:GNAT superfamily N-acetyltransferase